MYVIVIIICMHVKNDFIMIHRPWDRRTTVPGVTTLMVESSGKYYLRSLY